MFFKEPTTIANLYDSHVHWMYTGQLATMWNLKTIVNPKDLLLENPSPAHFQGDWLVGFGWDENLWSKEFKVHRSFLDQTYPNYPVFLSRTDGHTSWVNTQALKILGHWDKSQYHQDVEVDQNGIPTGVLRESAHIQALFSLPAISDETKKQHLIKGADIFNLAGFTHIRDMTSNAAQWKLHQEIQNELLLHVEHFFSCENRTDFERALKEALSVKPTENQRMKIRGIKVFVDGSLGSETALLSTCYHGSQKSGQLNWSEDDIRYVLKESWKNKLEVALHTLGDEAAHKVALIARQIYAEGIMGRLHLEHAELLRPETIQVLKSVHVRCHLQPCHWFSDSKWLQEKLGELAKYAFPWQALTRAQIPISFGSDAPIEPSNFFTNLRALKESSKKGIPGLKESPVGFHQYPYSDALKGETLIQEDRIKGLRFGELQKSFT